MFFETKGVTLQKSESEPFMFVLIDAPSLHDFGSNGGDSFAFAEHFREPGDSAGVAFDNLGRDARLIAPRPPRGACGSSHAHLAKFVREAPEEDIRDTLIMVAQEYMKRLRAASPHPVWLSTSGLGVAWLHFRLDSSPKYYQFGPFTKAPTTGGRKKKRRRSKSITSYYTSV